METNAATVSESAQPLNLADVKRKTHFTGTVLKTTLAGAIVDIGLDTPGVVHISQLQEQPTNRVEDVVKAVLYMVKDAPFMTGSVIRLDGGYVLGGETVDKIPKGIL